MDFSDLMSMVLQLLSTPTPDAVAAPKPSGPPEPTEESKERYRQAQLAQQERSREQAERRHRSEAVAGEATSARPAAAKKTSQPSGGDFVNLYRSLPVAQKNMAFDVMQKMLSDVNAAAMAPPPAAPDAPPPAVPKETANQSYATCTSWYELCRP